MIVANASPIINFGKLGKLEIFKKCFDKVLIPKKVYDEIIIKEKSPEAMSLEKAISDKWIKVQKIKIIDFLDTKKLGQGEKEAISLALKNKCLVLIDDDSAKIYASILNIESHGTIYVLFVACKNKIISKEEAKEIFEKIIKNGFYLTTDLYSAFFKLLKDI